MQKILFIFLALCLMLTVGCARPVEAFPEETIPASNIVPETTAPSESAPEAVPAPEPAAEEKDEVTLLLERLTLEQKVAQMFMVSPENISDNADTTVAGEATRAGIEACPVGGILYFGPNLVEPEQTKKLLQDTLNIYEDLGALKPLLAVDEEGGVVARIGGNENFPVERIGPMLEVEDTDGAYRVGTTIGQYLHALGFNMDFAPVADVLSNPSNQVIGNRSFGSDPEQVGQMAVVAAQGLQEQGIVPVFKHFPGHGATEADSHEGYVYTDKGLDTLMDCELVPFLTAIDSGAEIIMAGHISVPNVTGNDLPATLSEDLLTSLLREQMGYDGIIITDAMGMGAITASYSSAEAAVKAIAAGADMILMPEDFHAAYQGVLDAVAAGELSETRINESVERIVRLKLGL